jgi:hypothetical protein
LCFAQPDESCIDDESKIIRNYKFAAPEIIYHQWQYFITALLDDLQGIQIAQLKWVQ